MVETTSQFIIQSAQPVEGISAQEAEDNFEMTKGEIESL